MGAAAGEGEGEGEGKGEGEGGGEGGGEGEGAVRVPPAPPGLPQPSALGVKRERGSGCCIHANSWRIVTM